MDKLKIKKGGQFIQIPLSAFNNDTNFITPIRAPTAAVIANKINKTGALTAIQDIVVAINFFKDLS